jgi:hypothetical protein
MDDDLKALYDLLQSNDPFNSRQIKTLILRVCPHQRKPVIDTVRRKLAGFERRTDAPVSLQLQEFLQAEVKTLEALPVDVAVEKYNRLKELLKCMPIDEDEIRDIKRTAKDVMDHTFPAGWTREPRVIHVKITEAVYPDCLTDTQRVILNAVLRHEYDIVSVTEPEVELGGRRKRKCVRRK